MYPTTPPPPPGALTPPPPPPPTKSKSGRNLLITIGAVFGILTVVALLGEGVTTVDTVTAPTTTGQAVEITTEPPDTEPATTTRQVTTTTETMRDLLMAWYSDHGTVFQDLVDRIDDVTTAGENGDLYRVSVACGDLAVAVDEARALPPMPDPATNGHWQAALAAFGGVARACIDGDYDMAGVYAQDGTAALTLATSALEAAL